MSSHYPQAASLQASLLAQTAISGSRSQAKSRIIPAGTLDEFALSSSTAVDNENWLLNRYEHTLWGDITAGPDGALWFTEPSGTFTRADKIGRITSAGTIREFALPTPTTHAYAIATGTDGNLWFTTGLSRAIGRITPAGLVTLFPVPSHLFPTLITAGPDGNLWFTDADLDGNNDNIGRITPAGTIREFPVPFRQSHLNGITPGPDRSIWFTEDTSNHAEQGKIGRITPVGVMRELSLPTPSAGPGEMVVGPDGTLWFAEMHSTKIAHLVCCFS